MKPPETYSDWSNCLDRLIDGSLKTSDLQYLDCGKIEWIKGSAERFATRFDDAYDKVIKQSADRLEKNLSLNVCNELEIIKALGSTRRTLEFLFQLSSLKSIPQDLKNHLQSKIDNYIKRTHSSLEQSAKADKSGRLGSLLRNNSLLNFNKEVVQQSNISVNTNTNNLKPQRRILL